MGIIRLRSRIRQGNGHLVGDEHRRDEHGAVAGGACRERAERVGVLFSSGMAQGTHYFDRQAQPIALEQWAEMWRDTSYRFVERTRIQEGAVEVVTTWEGFDPYRVQYDDGPPRLFRVAELRWKNGKIQSASEHEMSATEAEACGMHAALVSALRKVRE